MTDIVERLREGVWGRARRADAVIHANMQDGAAEIEWLRDERQRLADELGKAHLDVLPWIEQVGWLTGEWNLLVAALKQAADGLREVGAIHAADGIDAMLKEREPWSKTVFLPATKLT
jgi:hypothetical protein